MSQARCGDQNVLLRALTTRPNENEDKIKMSVDLYFLNQTEVGNACLELSYVEKVQTYN